MGNSQKKESGGGGEGGGPHRKFSTGQTPRGEPAEIRVEPQQHPPAPAAEATKPARDRVNGGIPLHGNAQAPPGAAANRAQALGPSAVVHPRNRLGAPVSQNRRPSVMALQQKAEDHEERGEWQEALDIRMAELEYRRKNAGTDMNPEVAEVCVAVGDIFKAMRRRAEALEYYQRALDICTQVVGAESSEVAVIYTRIGELCAYFGDHLAAYGYCRKAYDILRATVGERDESAQQLHHVLTRLRAKAEAQANGTTPPTSARGSGRRGSQ
eukprot:tig00021428_g21161.t1